MLNLQVIKGANVYLIFLIYTDECSVYLNPKMPLSALKKLAEWMHTAHCASRDIVITQFGLDAKLASKPFHIN